MGGGGKYFLYLYPIYSLNSEFQVPNTKIGGSALKRGPFYPQNPSLRGGRGSWGEGVNIFDVYIQCTVYILSFRFLTPKLGVQPSKGGNFTPKTPRYGGGQGGRGVNIFEIYIQNEAYMPSFSFLAPKL